MTEHTYAVHSTSYPWWLTCSNMRTAPIDNWCLNTTGTLLMPLWVPCTDFASEDDDTQCFHGWLGDVTWQLLVHFSHCRYVNVWRCWHRFLALDTFHVGVLVQGRDILLGIMMDTSIMACWLCLQLQLCHPMIFSARKQADGDQTCPSWSFLRTKINTKNKI